MEEKDWDDMTMEERVAFVADKSLSEVFRCDLQRIINRIGADSRQAAVLNIIMDAILNHFQHWEAAVDPAVLNEDESVVARETVHYLSMLANYFQYVNLQEAPPTGAVVH